jgi:hypothetical protein
MSSKLLPATALVAIALASASLAHADSEAEMAAREAKASRALSQANEVSNRHGHYRQPRGTYLEGTGSLAKRAETWNQQALDWVNAWFRIYALVDLKDNQPYTQFEAALADAMKTQATTLTRLTNEGGALAREAVRLGGPVGADVPAAYSELGSFVSVTDGLTRREGELKAAFQDVAAQIPARITDLTKIDQTSRVGVVARLKAALLAKKTYPLEQTLAAVQSLLTAESVVDPLLAELSRAEQEMTALSLSLRIFRAQDLNAETVDRCNRARTTLASLAGPAAYLASARRTADQLCASSAANYQSLQNLGGTKAQLVTAVVNRGKRGLPALCAKSGAPAECEKLAIIAAIPAAKLAASSEAELKFIELEWASLLERANQRAGGS